MIVSTDDDEIAETAVAAGADVPFRRPEGLGRDETTTYAVVRHVLDALAERGGPVQIGVVVLQPTSPLRTAAHIDAAIDLLSRTKSDSVVGLRPIEHPLEWAVTLGPDARVRPRLGQVKAPSRRQDAALAYWPNGAIYASWTAGLLERDELMGPDTRGYVMTPEESIDIDTEFDLLVADALLKYRQ